MGGEYLPSYQREETEIGRIELESTTSDVISIRARWEDGQIHYRVVDEYDTEFDCKLDRSDGPLSLDEFIRFIDAIACQDLCGPFSLAYNQLTGRESWFSRRAWLGLRWWSSKKCSKGLVVQPFYRQLVNAPCRIGPGSAHSVVASNWLPRTLAATDLKPHYSTTLGTTNKPPALEGALRRASS